MSQAESSADEPAVPEELAHLGRSSGGHDVEILGLPLNEEVANTTAHQVGRVSGSIKSIEHSESPGRDMTPRDRVFTSGQNSHRGWFWRPHGFPLPRPGPFVGRGKNGHAAFG